MLQAGGVAGIRRAWSDIPPHRRLLAAGIPIVVVAALTPGATGRMLWTLAAAAAGLTFLLRMAGGWDGLTPAWRLITAGFGVRLAAGLVWSVEAGRAGGPAPFPALNDIGFVASYLLLIGGLLWAAHRAAGGVWQTVLDALVLAVGMGVISWTLLLHPYLHDSDTRGAALALALTYPLCDLVVFAAAVRMTFTVSARNPANRLVLLAVGAMLAANTVYFAHAAGGATRSVDVLDNALWLLSYVLLGAAGLHPAMLVPTGNAGVHETPMSGARSALLAVATLIGPAALAGLAVTRDDAWGADEWRHFLVPAALSGAMCMLLVLRLSIAVRLAQQRSAQLDRQARDLADALAGRQALEQQLRHHTLHDPLTGLANRALLAERMDWALSRRPGTVGYAVLLIDVDGFKDVNDTLGHCQGDALLLEVAQRLRRLTTPADTLARLGADEFALFVEDFEAGRAAHLAERLRTALTVPFAVAGRPLHLTASMGLATVGAAGTGPQDAIRDADLALRAAKRAGRDRLVVFRPELRTARETYTRLADGLRRALNTDELAVHYQPVVELASGRPMAVEALLRWTPPSGAPVCPADFIPVAEQTSMIVPVGAWVLRRACADAYGWHQRHGISLTVNVSGRQLAELDFADRVLRTLDETGLPASALILEITETVLVQSTGGDDGCALAMLGRLREHGVRVAIDDFGTGYSSLSYLTRLPVDILKIDRSFVPATGAADADDHAFTRAVLQIGASRRLPAIAEGVETEEQAQLLRDMGCPLAQGFLFARPAAADAVEAVLSGLGAPTVMAPAVTR